MTGKQALWFVRVQYVLSSPSNTASRRVQSKSGSVKQRWESGNARISGRRSGGAHPCLVSRDNCPAHCSLPCCRLVVNGDGVGVAEQWSHADSVPASSLLASGGVVGPVNPMPCLTCPVARGDEDDPCVGAWLLADVLRTAKTLWIGYLDWSRTTTTSKPTHKWV